MSEEKKDCPCYSTSCPRHGKCEECKEYHHSRDQLTYCEKNKKNN